MTASVKGIPDPERKALFSEAIKMRSEDRYAGARHLFLPQGSAPPRLHPMYWGISKQQLVEFKGLVRQAILDGYLKPQSEKKFYYPRDKFESESVGPNIYQVNEGLIKPMTEQLGSSLPGLSYAVLKNLNTGGLKCNLFISHAWGEGVFEFIDNALCNWPDDCANDGAYICCFSNPQNLDIAQLLGDDLKDSTS